MKIFFYQHRYMRDRQIDTVRTWPESDVVLNRAAFDGRRGSQVSPTPASRPRRGFLRNLFNRLPLLNLKWRSPRLEPDVIIYCWGGIPLWGPFIVEIDNPYCLTGYRLGSIKLFRPILRSMLLSKRCKGIRCISQAACRTLALTLGADVARRASIVYPRLSTSLNEPHLLPDRPLRLLFVATQFEIKGGEAVLRAFHQALAKGADIYLTLVTHLPERFKPLASNTRIRCLEACFSRTEILNEFMLTHHVLVIPTMVESFGMVVLEAMSAGMAVVASDCYAIPELVEDNVTGFIVSPKQTIWAKDLPTEDYIRLQAGSFSVQDATTSDLVEQLVDVFMKLTKISLDDYRRASLARFKALFDIR